ncbi:SIR2 family NAD-dependent protein deacylase [Cyclobacterium qasimii]|uniref:protein acetyllysine N-acetyltransferase n=2 Tax=Cyclobacterium qasimii TaxID=1350429 RepID=S7WVN4_9BACT|nr:Sir2 family NAD-dependent protein deacetylase [Cyclobacterium qasimii]EPR70814.1 NAD-dependent protein deacetylase of SIR2 family [Cyclobacterium qasimii M12-11B]GEO24076.1 NAD-dependent protein deacylase [Cyclobacterium qasimii]
MKHLVILTGAGISAESGLKTFRDDNGLWEGHDVMEVASPKGWENDKEKVLNFYNLRRKACLNAKPNKAHLKLAALEDTYKITIITQNVDNLHEIAGSSSVLHLHGELFKAQSTIDPNLIYPIEGWELNLGDKCEKGSQLRPYIVWFGEPVPKMSQAILEVESADALAVIGTSMLVYPAAGLIDFAAKGIPKFIIDPKIPVLNSQENIFAIKEKASTGVNKLENLLKNWNFKN